MLDARRLVSLGRVSAAVPSPDATWVAVAVAHVDAEGGKYVSALWRVPMDGGEAIPLTRGKADDRAPCFRRDGSLAFLSNRDPGTGEHDEARSQVWLLPAAGGEPRPLTDEPLGVGAFRFARGADRLVCVAGAIPGVARDQMRKHAVNLKKIGPSALTFTETPVRHWDHWRGVAIPRLLAFEAEGGGRVELTPELSTWALGDEPAFDVSEDGTSVAVGWDTRGADGLADRCVRVLSLDGSVRILGEEAGVTYDGARISPDGTRIAAVRHARKPERFGPLALGIFEADGRFQTLAAEVGLWFDPAGWTADGRVLCTADDRGHTPVYAVDAQGVTRITATASGGSHEGLSVASNGAIIGLRHRTTHPPEAFRVEARAEAVPELLTSLSGFSEAEARSQAEVSTYQVLADDGVPMHGISVIPHAATSAPALMWVHGGPIGAWGDGWHWRWNPLVAASAGYALFLPNPRGSTGFGEAFVEGIWGNHWGDQCYRDVMAFADAMSAHKRVDPARIAAMGGSFGGYMTNWIGGSTGRFQALVTHASVWSMSAFTGVTDHPGWWRLQMRGTSFGEGRDAFDRWSPERLAEHWTTPTLVIHGEKDYRCPISEGLALFDALQHHGVPSQLLVFPDEGHWITRPRNILAWYDTVLAFLAEKLA